MNDTILELGLFQDMIFPGDEINTTAFQEFCKDLDALDALVGPELYLEALVDNRNNREGRFKSSWNNTVSTTKDVMGAYDQTTEGNSKLIKGIWDLVMAAVSLIVKITNFIVSNLSKIPTLIANTIVKISQLPASAVNKIRGNITIYISAGDIQGLYNKVFPAIKGFTTLAETMSQGDFWGTFWKPRDTDNPKNPSENDMKLGKDLRKKYSEIQLLEFHPSIIEINDDTRQIYFQNAKVVKFHDLAGKAHDDTYLDSMKVLSEDLKKLKKPIEAIRSMIGEKYEKSQMDVRFAKLGAKAQREVSESIQAISKVITIIGNLIRYTKADMTTMQKSAITVQKKVEKDKKRKASMREKENKKETKSETNSKTEPPPNE